MGQLSVQAAYRAMETPIETVFAETEHARDEIDVQRLHRAFKAAVCA